MAAPPFVLAFAGIWRIMGGLLDSRASVGAGHLDSGQLRCTCESLIN